MKSENLELMGRGCQIILILIFSILSTYGQGDAYFENDVSRQEFEEVIEGLTYTKTKKALRPKPIELEEHEDSSRTFNASWLNAFSFFEILAYGLILFLISYILFIVFSNIKIQRKDSESDIILSVEEEDIEEMDLDTALEDALRSRDYRLAVRIRFLYVLQSLSKEGLIKWRPEKTNRDYTSEIRSKVFYRQFKELARLFEIIWYGNTLISESEYEDIAVVFDGFNGSDQ